MESTAAIDVPTTILVLLGMLTALAAVAFGWSFSRAIGGELGGAFKWVLIGTSLFALTRVDDLMKVSGLFTRMHVDYQKVMWAPHHLGVFIGWGLIAFGFWRMARTFRA